MDSKSCWCGNQNLQKFSPDYYLCQKCSTLVLNQDLSLDSVRVNSDENEFYSKKYWLSYQTDEYGYPDIRQRSRQDLPERCLYWLRTLMTYALPPGKVLELGCAHGGSVALMKWAGFDASGLELSPWVVDFAQKTFDVSMLLGPIEDQQLEPKSFDAIVFFDVLEHLPDPLATMRHVASLLKDEGVLIVQTPDYVEKCSYAEMLAQKDNFLDQLKPREHTYLFSRRSISEFFSRLGFDFLNFEEQLFSYDMFFAASRYPLVRNVNEQIFHNLSKHSSGRLILALFDQSTSLNELDKKYQNLESDREECLKSLEQYTEANSHIKFQLEIGLAGLSQSQSELERTRSELSQSQSDLERTRSELSQSQSDLERTRSELNQSQSELERTCFQVSQSQSELERTRSQLNQSQLELERTRSELGLARLRVEEVCSQVQDFQQSQLQQMRNEIDETESELEETNQEIAAMKTSKFVKFKSLFS